MFINPNIKNIISPPIPKALSWIKYYDGSMGEIIDMSQAVPSYPPHENLIKYFIDSSSNNEYAKYGDIEGDIELRNEYCKITNFKYETSINNNQVLISSGCNQAYVVSLLTIAETGDEIMISNPGYFSHELSIKMLGLKPNFFNLDENNFSLNFDEIEKNYNPKVKAITIVSPGNPTGAIFNSEALDRLLSFCHSKGVYLILDETYRDFIYPYLKKPHNLFQSKLWKDILIQLYSFSKSCCIPGHRLGALIAGKEVINQMNKVMDNIQICASRPSQQAVGKFLNQLESFQKNKTEEIGEKSLYFNKIITSKTSWEVSSIGAFFAYVKHPFKSKLSSEISKRLATELGIISLPGNCFGINQDNYLRFSFGGLNYNQIEKIPERLKKFLVK